MFSQNNWFLYLFSCEQCGGEIYPEYYKGVHGIEYKYRKSSNQKRPGGFCKMFPFELRNLKKTLSLANKKTGSFHL